MHKLKDERIESDKYFNGIDWSGTKAFACGLTGIYLNIKGREAKGIVKKNEVDSLKNELIERLEKITDPKTEKPVIREQSELCPWRDVLVGPRQDGSKTR